jgi:erythromycin esterase-like protein
MKETDIPQYIDIDELISRNSIDLDPDHLDGLIEKIGNAKYVLLGEASHGTHEYYSWRAKISKKLIKEKGFSFIAVEGDWPDCYRVNRYVRNYKDSGKSAFDVLHAFNRWPTWMWANWEMVALIDWMKMHNEKLPRDKQAGFYGLDVYSLWESLDSIISYLDKVDRNAKETAMKAFRCFEPYNDKEGTTYAHATQFMTRTCEKDVLTLLMEIMRKLPQYNTDHEAVLSAEQNAHVIADAEKYYRTMLKFGTESWNIRDRHMVSTLDRLMDFHGKDAKGIIWEHNTHIGDARATSMASDGTINVGQLLNEHHQGEVYSVGFGSYEGMVVAGHKWGDEMRAMHVPEAIPGSWESFLHGMNAQNRILFMGDEMKRVFGKKVFGHRAIGVVYDSKHERHGNYVPSIIPWRYNAFIYIDRTTALHPLHIRPDGHQMPETYPFGL